MSPAPVLVLAVGNPSRGDDALGPELLARLEERVADLIAGGQVELLTDFQLHVEHALDLTDRGAVVFVDASVTAAPPFAWAPARARPDAVFGSHALAPEAVLEAHRRALGPPPEAWVLAVRGDHFELGAPLGPDAARHLEAAVQFLEAKLRDALCRRPRVQGA